MPAIDPWSRIVGAVVARAGVAKRTRAPRSRPSHSRNSPSVRPSMSIIGATDSAHIDPSRAVDEKDAPGFRRALAAPRADCDDPLADAHAQQAFGQPGFELRSPR